MTTENGIRILAGTMALTGAALSHYVHPNWIWLVVFVGVNLIQSAFTGFCPAALILEKTGLTKSAR